MNETINGLHSCKPGNDPKVGETKTFVIENKTSKNGKAYLKIKAAGADFGGTPYRILSAEPTGYVDSYGNHSYNLEIESTKSMEQKDAPDYPRNAPQAPPARPNGVTLQDHANRAGDVFDAAWTRAGKSMETLMPLKDAQDMKLEMYYDIKMRIAQYIGIQVDRKM